jgi:hypothetical protein
MFATEAELEAFTGASIDGNRAAMLLDIATGAIRGETGQTMSVVEDDEVTLVGAWGRRLVLPQWPVTDVSAVSIDGTALTADDYTWQRRGILWLPRGFTLTPSTAFDTGSQHWGGPDLEVVVTYSHGVDPMPEYVRNICLAAAARMLANPDGVLAEQIDGYSVTYDRASSGVSLSPDEKRQLRKWKRRI